jgi:very-short-patch-repair endonuclease
MNCIKCNIEFGNHGGLVSHQKSCRLSKQDVINIKEEYSKGLSIKYLASKYKIGKCFVCKILEGITRSPSEASKLSHKLNPGLHKHTPETKEKLRQSRLKWMKENPEKTAWRLSNLSYPEKVFQKKLKELELDKKYLIIRERSVFPYFIDFAFEDEKLAIEIDGSQHENEDRKESDNVKDNLLISEGWNILRFSASKVNKNIDECFYIVLSHLSKSKSSECGIFLYKDYKKIQNEKNIVNFGKTQLQIDGHLSQRKVNRPPYVQLLQEVKELGYKGTGKKYGVSDNSIRKWIRMYKKHGENF